ncbi:MAG TPA: sigma-70 family RNA polymerase sigma factor [Solirubrobacteraceae bacterium]|nr:sigma-70 family RNA polymerase sigma factor [Solirubrobacteraceae bacterium]
MEAVVCLPGADAWELDDERTRLVESHIRLAERIARKRCRWGREDPDDTRSDAFWGLLLAGRAFQPGRGSFTAYAVVRIEGAIRRGRQIRSGLSRTLWEQGDHQTPLSLNLPCADEGDTELLDLLPAPSDAEHDWLPDAIRRLPARDALILRLRYYHGLSQADVGPIIGCSQMQISRLERNALAVLREAVVAA